VEEAAQEYTVGYAVRGGLQLQQQGSSVETEDEAAESSSSSIVHD